MFFSQSKRHCIDFLSTKNGYCEFELMSVKTEGNKKPESAVVGHCSVRRMGTCIADVWGSFFKCIILHYPIPSLAAIAVVIYSLVQSVTPF